MISLQTIYNIIVLVKENQLLIEKGNTIGNSILIFVKCKEENQEVPKLNVTIAA